MFDNKTIFALKRSLDGLAVRQKVIAGNIANLETPGYKAKDVLFEQELDKALTRYGSSSSQSGSIGAKTADINPVIVVKGASSMRVDGNTVDSDIEMADLAETSLRFEAASRLLSKKYQTLRSIIMEGRR